MYPSTVHPRAGGEHRLYGAHDTGTNGSSPRGRGTHTHVGFCAHSHRFIPARAGNTHTRRYPQQCCPVHPRAGGEHSRPIWDYRPPSVHPRAGGEHQCRSRTGRARRTVHPRAGGEHAVGAVAGRRSGGSSPRGRGTPSDQRLRDRFIPARAGNTLPLERQSPHGSSPRGRGTLDHCQPWSRASGSSPRGRGTHCAGIGEVVDLRFIPARAGNTAPGAARTPRTPVHPRAGGEHREPRAPVLAEARFIPARAGNTPASVMPNRYSRGSSPRGRGTRDRATWTAVQPDGSSPRGRGTQRPEGDERQLRRPVHPRAGGEHSEMAFERMLRIGSSPRGRGTLRWLANSTGYLRFIPARAGNTVHRSRMVRRMRRFIPARAGNTHTTFCIRAHTTGSSPRGRGTRPDLRREIRSTRFIPARAGNTSRSRVQGLRDRFIPARAGNTGPRCRWAAPTVHPRAGGEHAERGPGPVIMGYGSSPRGRGTLASVSGPTPPLRFIPARAGNTLLATV